MRKQLMIGICKASRQLIEDFKNRGGYSIVAGPRTEGRTFESLGADEYWEIDTSDIDELERRCRLCHVSAVNNGISTYNIGICMELAKRLGIPCYATPEAWHYTVNKRDFKNLCHEVGVPVPKDYYVSDPPQVEELKTINYPVVVKAINLSANRGMSYCYRPEDILPAYFHAKHVSKCTNVVIEKMLKGREYTAHYAIADGNASLISFCSMHHQTGYPNNCYSITTTETDQLDNYLYNVHPSILNFITKAGIKEGVCWFEMMMDSDGKLYVLEMGYRMSGDLFAIPIKNVCGFDSYKWLNDISIGIQHSADDLPPNMQYLPENVGTSYILWSNEKGGVISRIDGLEEVAKIPDVEIDNILTVGSIVKPHQYLSVILIKTKDIASLVNIIRKINETVFIENENGENLIIRFTDFHKLEF